MATATPRWIVLTSTNGPQASTESSSLAENSTVQVVCPQEPRRTTKVDMSQSTTVLTSPHPSTDTVPYAFKSPKRQPTDTLLLWTVPGGTSEEILQLSKTEWRPVWPSVTSVRSVEDRFKSELRQWVHATTQGKTSHIDRLPKTEELQIFEGLQTSKVDSKQHLESPLRFPDSDKQLHRMPKIPRKPFRPGNSTKPKTMVVAIPPYIRHSTGIQKKPQSRLVRIPEDRKKPKGLTMCLRKMLRCLLAGTRWIVSDKIGKAEACGLIKLLISPEAQSSCGLLSASFEPLTTNIHWKELHYDRLLANIINVYLGTMIEGSDVNAYITRSSGKYYLSPRFKEMLGMKPWPPHLPSPTVLQQYGCYTNPKNNNL